MPVVHQPADFLCPRGVKKNVKHVGMVAQKIRRPASYHDRIPFLRDSVHDLLHQHHHAIRIEYLTAKRRTAFIAPAPESSCQPVEAAIHALVAAHDGGRSNVGEAGNFFGEEVVPELPAHVVGELGGDGAPAAAVLALNGDDAKHPTFSVPPSRPRAGFFSSGRPWAPSAGWQPRGTRSSP